MKHIKLFETYDKQYEELKNDFLTKFPTKNDFLEWSLKIKKSDINSNLRNLFQGGEDCFDRIISELKY